MLDLATHLRDLPERQGDPPWPGYEYVKGWSVSGLPFDSGHVLALRVFPENDFSPYRTVCIETRKAASPSTSTGRTPTTPALATTARRATTSATPRSSSSGPDPSRFA